MPGLLGRACGWLSSVTANQRPGSSKEKFVSLQHAIGGIVEELPEEGSPPGSSILIGLKELPLWYAMMRRPGIGWLGKYLT
jgi:hypothetical protein